MDLCTYPVEFFIKKEPTYVNSLTMANTSNYSADNIRALKGLEAVRMRPGMYVGGTDARALHQLVWEVLDNSVDEALAGHCDTINIIIG